MGACTRCPGNFSARARVCVPKNELAHFGNEMISESGAKMDLPYYKVIVGGVCLLLVSPTVAEF